MRNPWGSEKYNGPWSDADKRWTPELMKQADHVHGNDGTFYMDLPSYKASFSGAYFVLMYQDWKVHRMSIKINYPIEKFYRSFISPVDQEAVLYWDYQSERHYPATCKTTTPSHLTKTRLKVVGGKYDSSKNS